MTRKILAVDVDLTVVDTGKTWWEWLCYKTHSFDRLGELDERIRKGEMLPYNLGELFNCPAMALDYFRQADLYDDLSPIPGTVEALKEASKYVDVVFVSRIKGNHAKSKFYFLKHHFPFMLDAMWGHAKGVVRCNSLIDDRVSNLNTLRHGEKAFLIKTPYKQDAEAKVDIIKVSTIREAVGYMLEGE